jgi:hypothetical protein
MPALRKAQDIGHAPSLPGNIILLAGEKMATAIARGLTIGVGNVLKARQRPNLG